MSLRPRARVRVRALTAAAGLAIAAGVSVAPALAATGEASFETSTTGWSGWNAKLSRVALPSAPGGAYVAKVARTTGTSFTIDDALPAIGSTTAAGYTAGASVRSANSTSVGKYVTVRVRETTAGGVLVKEWVSRSVALTTSFQRVTLSVVPSAAGHGLDLRVSQTRAGVNDAFYADLLGISAVPAPAPAPPPATDPAPAPVPPPTPAPPPALRSAEAFPYDPAALFNRPIPASAPTDPRSADIVSEFVANTRVRKVSATTDLDTPPVYVASAADPFYTVTVGGRQIQFRVPAGVVAGSGSDYPIVILDPSTTLWGRAVELRIWRAVIDPSTRTISGDGTGLFHYNNDGAILDPLGTRSLSTPFLGVGTGSGLSYLAGMIRPEEVAEGRIDHAIRIAYACNDSSSRFRAPAVRTDQPHPDCSADTTLTPAARRMDMGMRLQLDPSVDCDARTAPVLPGRTESVRETRFLRIVCHAMQDYGLVMLDGAGPDATVIYMENRATAPWSSVAGEEYWASYGWVFRDRLTPSDSLARDDGSGIPWSRLRVIADGVTS